MYKITFFLLSCLCVALSCNTAFAQRKIYVGHGESPLYDHKEYFQTLTETSEGSNIYIGDIHSTEYDWYQTHLHFYSRLWEEYDEWGIGPVKQAYEQNVIIPGTPETRSQIGNSPLAMTEIASGLYQCPIYFAERYNYDKYGPLPSICVEIGTNADYRLILDLNKGDLKCIDSSKAYAIVFDDDETPTVDTWESYLTLNRMKYVAPREKLRFKMYNLYQDEWYGQENPTTYQANKRIEVQKDPSFKNDYVIENWPGGVYDFQLYSKYFPLTPTLDQLTKAQISANQLTFRVRTNTSLYNSTDYIVDKGDDGLFHFTLPKGTSQFSIFSTGEDPNVNIIWDEMQGYINEKNQLVLIGKDSNEQTRGMSDPITDFEISSFSYPSIDVIFNPYDCTVKFPNQQPTANYILPEDINGEYGKDYLWLTPPGDSLEPRLNMSATTLDKSKAIKLSANGDGTFFGKVSYPQFRIIKSLGNSSDQNIYWGPENTYNEYLVDAYGYGESTAYEYSASSSSYWSFPRNHRTYTVTFNPSTSELSIMRKNTAPYAYLIGTPNNWTKPSEENEELFENWKLPATTEGFYGHFYLEEGSHSFAFNTSLHNDDSYFTFASGSDSTNISYTSLTNEGDNYNAYSDLYYEGKGFWTINDWPGGELYVFIDTLNSYTLFISANPIAEAGDYIGDADTFHPMYETTAFKPIGNNEFSLDTPLEMGKNIHLFSRQSPYSLTGPRWKGTYSLRPVGHVSDFNQHGIATQKFEICNDISTQESLFTTPTLSEISGPKIRKTIIDMENNTIYYFIELNLYVMEKDQIDYLNDHHKDWSKFDGKIIPYFGQGILLDVPAGKFDFVVHSLGREVNKDDYTVDLSKGYNHNWGTWNGYRNLRLVCPDWEGGKILLGQEDIMKIDDNFHVRAQVSLQVSENNLKSEYYDLSEISENIYSGEYIVKDNSYALYFKIGTGKLHDGGVIGDPYYDYELGIGRFCWLTYGDECEDVQFEHARFEPDFSNNCAEIPVRLEGTPIPLHFAPNTILKYTLDLNNLTLHMEASEKNIDLIQIENEKGKLETLNQTSDNDKLSFTASNNNLNQFTVRNANGKYLMPTEAAMAPRRRGVRGLPKADKFGITSFEFELSDVPYYWEAPNQDEELKHEYLSLEFDLKTNTATVQNTGKNSDWIIATGEIDKNADDRVITNAKANDFDSFTKSAEKDKMEIIESEDENKHNVYSGSITFDNVENQAISIYKGVNFTHTLSTYDNIDLRDLKDGESISFDVRPFSVDEGFTEIKNDTPNASYDVRYDAKEQKLTFIRNDKINDKSNVIEKEVADNEIKIMTHNGGLTLLAHEDIIVPIHNMQGITLSQVGLKANVPTDVQLPCGLYILLGKKIIVR